MHADASLPVVIIGAGLAGWTVAREFRKLDTTTPLVLLTADAGDFYAKPTLSNAFAQQRTPAQLITTPSVQMAQTLNLTLRHHTRISALDTATQTLHTAQGPLSYRSLVLATGAQPIRLPLAGDAAAQVRSVNSLDDFACFYAKLSVLPPASRRVVIMGAGLIGCEFANDLSGSGVAVSVVDPSAGPLAALLPAAASTELAGALAQRGVDWHWRTTVQAVDRQAGSERLRVTLANGAVLNDVDVVLSAIGLRADLALAQAAGLVCERGVVVDAGLRTSAPEVYALGDVAQYAVGRPLPFVMPIMHAAKVIATRLAGQAAELKFPLMPVAVKTPALPLVVAAPAPGTPGGWQAATGDDGAPLPGEWHWRDAAGGLRGFVLAGPATARRMKLSAQVLPEGA